MRVTDIDKTIRKITDREQQQAEMYRDWRKLSVGERLGAVSELSAAAYGIKEDQIGPMNKTITRVQRMKGDDNA